MDNTPIFCLRDSTFFSGLSMEFFKHICWAACKQQVKKGQILFEQEDEADRIHIINAGRFKLLRLGEDGSESILQIIGPGELLGETALFRPGAVQLATAIALEDARVCSIDRDTFEKLIKNQPDLAWEIIKNMGNRLYNIWEQVSETKRQTTQEKVLRLMVRLAREHGKACTQGIKLTIPLTQQEIAALVGSSRVMVSQSIKELTNKNYLCREERHYILKNKCF